MGEGGREGGVVERGGEEEEGRRREGEREENTFVEPIIRGAVSLSPLTGISAIPSFRVCVIFISRSAIFMYPSSPVTFRVAHDAARMPPERERGREGEREIERERERKRERTMTSRCQAFFTQTHAEKQL